MISAFTNVWTSSFGNIDKGAINSTQRDSGRLLIRGHISSGFEKRTGLLREIKGIWDDGEGKGEST